MERRNFVHQGDHMLLALHFHPLETALLNIPQQMQLKILKSFIPDLFDETHDHRGAGEGLHSQFPGGHFHHRLAVVQDIVRDLAFPLCKMLFLFQFLQQSHNAPLSPESSL